MHSAASLNITCLSAIKDVPKFPYVPLRLARQSLANAWGPEGKDRARDRCDRPGLASKVSEALPFCSFSFQPLPFRHGEAVCLGA